jgi:hypothetical protein
MPSDKTPWWHISHTLKEDTAIVDGLVDQDWTLINEKSTFVYITD